MLVAAWQDDHLVQLDLEVLGQQHVVQAPCGHPPPVKVLQQECMPSSGRAVFIL